jgi:hypothetical protein
MVERRALKRVCAGEMYCTQSEQLHAEKAEEVTVQKWPPGRVHLVVCGAS